MRARRVLRLTITLLVVEALAAPVALAYDPAYEAANYAKINERATTDYTPEFNVLLAQQGLTNQASAASILASDGPARQYGRDFSGNLCANAMNGCAGDVRLYDFNGTVKPILFTARNGSTLSGHVWMTAGGPAKRPGVVITNGSVQAPETLYWFAAQTLAKAGYVVMTWDPQGQGYSDTYGDGADRNDGVPSQAGQPFYDGTEDALDFFFSTPAHPYQPRKSCSSGTSHADKQGARVADGRSSAFNPLSASLDTGHVGIVGHSLGAAAVSYVGQLDPRVKAIVAYDNLNDVSDPATRGFSCASGSSPRPATLPITKPVLGLSADYGLTPMPYTADPDAAAIKAKQAGSLAASRTGVDSAELIIRGGTHYEFAYIPNPAFGATRRGMDMTAWYTTAWMDKELRGDTSADRRLLTTRWRDDRLEGEVDGQTPPDPNLFSTYYPSRLDIALTAGGRFACEDLRTGCEGQSAQDGEEPDYSFIAAAHAPEQTPGGGETPAPAPGASSAPAGSTGAPPAATGAPAQKGINRASRCRPRSRITRISRVRGRRGRVLRIRGTARLPKGCAGEVRRVTVRVKRRPGHARVRRARGTRRWHARVRVRRGRYVVRSQARSRAGVREQPHRGTAKRLRVVR